MVYAMNGGMNLTTECWRSFFGLCSCPTIRARLFTGFSCVLFVVSCVRFFYAYECFDSMTAF